MDFILSQESEVIYKMNLKSVGCFREMLDGSPSDPSIRTMLTKAQVLSLTKFVLI